MRSMAVRTAARSSSLIHPYAPVDGYRPMVTTSRTVMGSESFTLVVWSTYETRRGRPSIGRMSIVPREGSVRPAMPLRVVDLPDPFGPMMAVMLLSLIQSDAADDLTRVDLGGRRIIKKK